MSRAGRRRAEAGSGGRPRRPASSRKGAKGLPSPPQGASGAARTAEGPGFAFAPAKARAKDRAGGRLVCLGTITGAKGTNGAVRVQAHTAEGRDLTAYGPLVDETGTRTFRVTLTGKAGKTLVARIAGVEDRNAAEALKGTRLCVPREALPEPPEDEFYHADLVGLRVETNDGGVVGKVKAVYDFGAGDVVELALVGGGDLALPFTRAVFPRVDAREGRLVVELAEMGGGPPPRRTSRRAGLRPRLGEASRGAGAAEGASPPQAGEPEPRAGRGGKGRR